MSEIDFLEISPAAFRTSPQRGVARVETWDAFSEHFTRATTAAGKDAIGGYALGRYRENIRRKANLEHVGALVVDVDEGGDVTVLASALAQYAVIVHETFSSTPEAPRCRVILRLAVPVDTSTYGRAHAIVRAHLRGAGVVADEGAKDVCRFSYWPVRSSSAGYAAKVVEGKSLDAHAIIAAQPPSIAPPPARIVAPARGPHYLRAAIGRAINSIATASAGERHALLNREAFALARFAIADADIEEALLPAFVAAAGETRRREGERTIADAIRARRRGAA